MELFPNESPQKHSQKRLEEDAGDFLPPDALISRAILKLSTTRSVETVGEPPALLLGEQKQKAKSANQAEEGETLPGRWRHLPAGNILSLCFPAR